MTAQRRNRADVLEAAFALLAEGGLEAVTLNAIARKLGSHLNTVSFQVKTKARLFELMADEVLGELDLDSLPREPLARIHAILERYRGALLTHRDGARLVAGTEAVERNTLHVADAIIGALAETGLDESECIRTFWALHYFLIGLVQEEQSRSKATVDRFVARASDGSYPALSAVGVQLVSEPFDLRFAFGIDILLSRVQLARSQR